MKKNGAASKPKPKRNNKNDKSKTTETHAASNEAGHVRGVGRKTLDIKMIALTCARLGKVELNNKSGDDQRGEGESTPRSNTGTHTAPNFDSPVVPRRLFCSQLQTDEQKTG